MTGPASVGSERGTGAPSRSTGTQGAVGAVLVVLALGLALRLIIAYLLPGSGFGVDLDAFRFWANDLATNGPFGFYDARLLPRLHARLPVRAVARRDRRRACSGGIGDLIKIPPILADLAIGWLVWSMVRELGGRRSARADRGAFVAVLNPISLVRQRGLGPGRFVRRRLRAARAARPVARPTGAGRDLDRRRRDHQAAARASSSRSSPWSPSGARSGRSATPTPKTRATVTRRRRRGARRRGPPRPRPCLGAPDGSPDPDRDDRLSSPWSRPSCCACRSGCRSSRSRPSRRS